MAKKHEEGNDLRVLDRGGKVRISEGSKTLRVSKGAVIGIKTWGRIDFLTHHRGWTLVSE